MTARVASLVLLLALCVSNPAQTHQHGSMPAGDGAFNPFLAADDRDGFYLAYIQRSGGSSDVMLRHSADGKVFSDPVRVNDRAGDSTVRNENPPKLAISKAGDVYACWANERAKWKGDIRFARSTDRGRTFSRAITLNSDAGAPPAGHAFQSVAVDGRGRIYVTWIDERNKTADARGAEIWISTSDDGGKTFSRDRRILSDVCECCRTNIQVDSAGRLFLSYRTVPSSGPMYRDIMVASSEDRGQTFASTPVSKDGWEVNGCPVTGPALCVDAADRVTVVWFTGDERAPGLYFTSSVDHGKSFGQRKLVDPEQKMGKHAQAMALADGKVLVSWDDAGGRAASVWALLDPGAGLLKTSAVREQVAYPVVAGNRKLMLMAGLKSGKDILVDAQPIQ